MAATTTAAAGGGGKGGTPVYMAPEQHDEEEFGQPGAKADIWALGCVLLEMVRCWSISRGLASHHHASYHHGHLTIMGIS